MPVTSSPETASVVRSMQHYLSNKLEGFSNGQSYPPSNPSNKTNGFAAAKVPDWQLRQWIAELSAEPASPDIDDDDSDYHRPDASGYSRADEEWFFDADGRP